MLHAEESRKYQVLSELPREEVEFDEEIIAKGEWVKDNFSNTFEAFVAICLLLQQNPKNVELDFLECYWAYCEVGNRFADETNEVRNFDDIFSLKGEEGEIAFKAFKEMKHSKRNKKIMTRVLKNLQKKGLIEIVHRNNWHQYMVNVFNPIQS